MPELIPSAMVSLPFSTTALHIAHWAEAIRLENKTKKKVIIDLYLTIIGRYHNIYNHTSNSYIQPKWKGNFRYFLVFFKLS